MARTWSNGLLTTPLPLPLCRRAVDRHGAAVTANAQLAHSGNVAMGSQSRNQGIPCHRNGEARVPC